MKVTIAELAQKLKADLVADSEKACELIEAVGPIETAAPSTVTFIKDNKRVSELRNSQAGAVIVARQIEAFTKPQLIVEDVDKALIKTLDIFAPRLHRPAEGVDPTAKIAAGVRIAQGVSIGPSVVIDKGVEIGEKTVISSGCAIGENSKIGSNCRLDSNVVIYHNCIIGNSVIIQANTTIGSTGFGYSFIDGSHRLIPHNGGVVIEAFVEIGANCCVDRAKFRNTVIGAGTKIDNLVQIAHNVVIGKCCLLAGQAGIGGSSRLGDGVVLGGGVGVSDNIKVGEGTQVGATSLVIKSKPAGKQLFGTPAMDKTRAFRIIGLTRRLPKLVELLKQLDERVRKLEASKNNKKRD
ncbi:MAG: UDP-3-O-(3-hydroxymyristoyl)glucosamine N-acyltransferase [Sedimentisphaerales bacterium]|nr:UDP-3-O-(3-hydroxymyristoyl)glucosamine N-acyltransferase [Sedimentisphaerales bacterium]